MPYGYYALSRLIFATILTITAYHLFKRQASRWVVAAALAVLYNPIIPIHLGSKELWALVNLVTILFVFHSEKSLRNR